MKNTVKGKKKMEKKVNYKRKLKQNKDQEALIYTIS